MIFTRRKQKNGDNIVIVKFEKGDNFNPDDQTWCPAAEHVEELVMELRFANYENFLRRAYSELRGQDLILRQPVFHLFDLELPKKA